MRASAVDRETDENVPARGAEPRREQAAAAIPEVGQAPTAMFAPDLLLGLQARAGNAAVAALIEEKRKPEPTDAAPPAEPPGISFPPAAGEAVALPPPLGEDREGAADAESSAAGPTSGESDEELAALDAAADAPPAASEAHADGNREAVMEDAQAELTDVAVPNGESPAAPGGGEAGVPVEARPPPHPPDLSGAEPAAGLAQVGALPPPQLMSSLGSVSSAVDRKAAQEHAQLAADPPQRLRHPGAPSTVEGSASSRIAVADRPAGNVQKVPERHDVEVRQPPGPPVFPEVATPDGQLPVRDPGLELKPGPLPHLPLEGSADPATVQQQHRHVFEGMQRERQAAQQDAAQPLGENQIFPSVAAETLRAAAPHAPTSNGHTPAAPVGDEDEAASIIAQQEKGSEIQGAVSSGLASLADQRSAYAQHASAERTKADAEMTQLEQANAQEQTAERAAAKGEVAALRGQWSTAQQELVAGGQREADAKTAETLETVSQERQAAEKQAAAHYQEGQHEADQARHQAEQQAATERQKAQSQGGLLGAIGSAAQSLFDKAKQAVQSAFDRARQLVRGAIERAQQLATGVMEKARQSIVGAIRTAGSVLIAIGDRVLVAFPTLRDRFRGLIQARIAAAEAAVNKLANALKQGVQAVLNGLSTALSAAIGLLRQGMLAAVDGVRATVRGALDFARGAIAAFGTFAVLVKDVAANPGQWISNLAAAARDGIRNHLWPDLQGAIQGWFNDKVDTLLGLGSAVWNLLKRGGITVAQVASVAWEGIKSMIPQTVIWVLIEKLVALIVPAAAAVMLIIQALQAAWGSLSRIVQAFDAFVAFLKGVRWGNAGPLFGKALAAGAVAVIEFISQFLLQRLMGAVGTVAGKIRALAKRIGARLAAAGRGIIRGAKWVGGKAIKLGSKLKNFTRSTIARPQVRWHAWQLGRVLKQDHPRAYLKLRQVKSDPGLDPALKLQFLKAVRSRLGPGVDPRKLMTKVVEENEGTFCRQGREFTAEEITTVAPLTKLVSLADIFDKHMLVEDYEKQFASFKDWQAALSRDPSTFDPKIHLRPDAKLGRWWSPLADTNEPTLELAVETRQLSADYAHGAIRARLSPEEAAKTSFHKPTAFDAMFFDPWQPPPAKAKWGFIRSQNGDVVIREAVAKPVQASSCSSFEMLLPGNAASASPTGGAIVKVMETLP